MEYGKFVEVIEERIRDIVGEGYDVSIRQALKNNSTKFCGIVISKSDEKISPSFYLESYYDKYNEGMDIDAIAHHIVSEYRKISENGPKGLKQFKFPDTFEDAKERIIARLFNAQMNEEIIKDCPHVRFKDLVIMFFYLVHQHDNETATIRITHDIIRMWGINTEEFVQCALDNTVKTYPVHIRDLKDVIEEYTVNRQIPLGICEGEQGIVEGGDCGLGPVYVISNSYNSYGAICMLYNGLSKEIAREFQSDVIFIPSSIHEVICMKKTEETDMEGLLDCIETVNDTQVALDELLSYNAYIYLRKEDKFISYTCYGYES